MGLVIGPSAATVFNSGQMNLDVNTLFLVTIYVEAILGLLLLFAWAQNAQIRAVAWWGSAHILRAGSVVLFGMYGAVSDRISIDFANVILFTTYAVLWAGARVFDGRKVNPLWVLAGAAVWIGAMQIPAIAASFEARVLLGAAIVTTYTWLTAYEFWCGRGEPLVSRWPAIFMLFAHGALFLLRTPLAAVLPWSTANQVFDSVWLTVLSFEALLFTIAISFILLAMAKERTELRHKVAAMIDPLTGLANRRAFLHEGAERLRHCAASGRPVAVLLIDLDHFKSINDRFGHAVGDRVLQVFAETANSHLRLTDMIGRIGGEEFAAILSGLDANEATANADRIRLAFAQSPLQLDGQAVAATVSVGVAATVETDIDLATLLAQADQALYVAKARGRNRVELAGLDLVRPPAAAATVTAAATDPTDAVAGAAA